MNVGQVSSIFIFLVWPPSSLCRWWLGLFNLVRDDNTISNKTKQKKCKKDKTIQKCRNTKCKNANITNTNTQSTNKQNTKITQLQRYTKAWINSTWSSMTRQSPRHYNTIVLYCICTQQPRTNKMANSFITSSLFYWQLLTDKDFTTNKHNS